MRVAGRCAGPPAALRGPGNAAPPAGERGGLRRRLRQRLALGDLRGQRALSPRPRRAPPRPAARSPAPRCTRSCAPAPSASRSAWPGGSGTTCLRERRSAPARPDPSPSSSSSPPNPAALTEGVEEVGDLLDGAGDHLDVLAVGPVLVDLSLHRVLLHRHGRRRRPRMRAASSSSSSSSSRPPAGSAPRPAAVAVAVRAARLLRDSGLRRQRAARPGGAEPWAALPRLRRPPSPPSLPPELR